ncbi:hypothetical protein ACI4CD_28805, partial [Klebsiella pneumoniae]|uniref:hypothetical protein n=1 Tax=Klebsiella pneumoniae TaxID=573 RepID=UPI0038544BB8
LLPGERLTRLIALYAALFTGWATWGLGLEAMTYGGVLLLAGLPIVLMVRAGRQAADGVTKRVADTPPRPLP